MTVPDGSTGPDPRVDRVADSLAGHVAGDAREARAVAEILDRLGTLARPFDRDAAATHITASAVVVGARGVLLHRHRRLLRWLQPGGHLDPGELPEDAALRECAEETGLLVRHPPSGPLLVHVDVHGAADDHVHLDLRYLVFGPDAEPAPLPGESQEAAWFSWDEATTLADDALVGALRSARRLLATGDVTGPGSTPEETDG
jgi:8-oxo-dGTP pyrophosphatase MutT (NUDIX family)